jgi:hypothetical protein
LFVGALIMIASIRARAEQTGTWSDAPDYVKEWLQTQKQPGSEISCCGLGDAINVEIVGEVGDMIRLRVTNGRGHMPNNTLLMVQKNRQVKSNLDVNGNDVAWVSSTGLVYCLSRAPKV